MLLTLNSLKRDEVRNSINTIPAGIHAWFMCMFISTTPRTEIFISFILRGNSYIYIYTYLSHKFRQFPYVNLLLIPYLHMSTVYSIFGIFKGFIDLPVHFYSFFFFSNNAH